MTSSASSILQHINAFRNPEASATSYKCGYAALAQLGYIVVIPYAIIEAAISQIAKAFAHCLHLKPEKYEKIKEWANSSATAILWAAHSVTVNFFTIQMNATEHAFSTSVLKKAPLPNPLSEIQGPNLPLPNPDRRVEPRLNPDPTPNPTPDGPTLPLPPFDPFDINRNNDAADEQRPKPLEDPAPKPGLATDKPAQETLPESAPVIQLDRIKVPEVNERIHLAFVEPGVKKIVQSYSIQPLQIEGAEPIDLPTLLTGYVLGDSAKSYTAMYDRICSDLPDPSIEEVFELAESLRNMGITRTDEWSMQHDLDEISREMLDKTRSRENERYIKMLFNTWTIVKQNNDPSDLEIFKICMTSADEACKVRKNDEIQRMFVMFVVPRYNLNISNEDRLIFEFMQERIRLRESLLNILGLNETHARNYYSSHLSDFFYLPKPAIVVDEGTPGDHIIRTARIKAAFHQCYNTTHAIYSIFNGFLYPKQNEKFNYKPEMFFDWLKANNLLDDAFADDRYTIYKPELVLRYLEETGFLKKKQQTPKFSALGAGDGLIRQVG